MVQYSNALTGRMQGRPSAAAVPAAFTP
jgi:hypothetical protein